MANDPLSLVRGGVLATMDTVDTFFDSGAKVANNILATFGLPQFVPEKKKKSTGQFITTEPPLTFALPSPQDILAPVGKAVGGLGAASPRSEDVEVF